MANLTNVSKEPLTVPRLGRVIQAGETVDVSDYVLTEAVWPASKWRIDGTRVMALAKGDDAWRPVPERQAKAKPADTADGQEEG